MLSGPRNSELFSKLYKGLVLLILEYCSPVCFPNLKKDFNALEKEQRRASKRALGNFGRDMSNEEGLMVLKWPTLEQTRLFLQNFFTFARDFRPSRANHRSK